MAAQRVRPMGVDHLVWCVHGLEAPVALFEAMGFTPTPRAVHPWGTANRLVVLDGSFIELLEIAEVALIPPHLPHRFSFGAYARDFAARREGLAMLALQTTDALATREDWAERAVSDYEAFHFARAARLPDGTSGRVAFTLAFATSSAMPEIAWFACEQHERETFTQATRQPHRNGGGRLVEVLVAAPRPHDLHPFLEALWDNRGRVNAVRDGLLVRTPHGLIRVVERATLAERFPGAVWRNPPEGPFMAGLRLRLRDLDTAARGLTRAGITFRVVEGRLLLVPQLAHNVLVELEPWRARGSERQDPRPRAVELEPVEPPVAVPVGRTERGVAGDEELGAVEPAVAIPVERVEGPVERRERRRGEVARLGERRERGR